MKYFCYFVFQLHIDKAKDFIDIFKDPQTLLIPHELDIMSSNRTVDFSEFLYTEEASFGRQPAC